MNSSDKDVDQRQAEDLQGLVLRRLAELGDDRGPLSAREAVRYANGLISYETLRMIARGSHGGGISDRVAEGLSLALRIPVARVYEVAGVPSPGKRWEWPSRFDRLNPAQRTLVEEMAAALLEAYDQGQRDARGR